MNATDETLVQEEQTRMRARNEAARRETAGPLGVIKAFRIIGLVSALIPFIGIAGVVFFNLVTFWMGIYVQFKGNSDGIKHIFLSVVFGLVGGVIWLAVSALTGILGALLN